MHYSVSDQSGSKAIENLPDNLPVRENYLWVSRKLIYGQAALLGVSAATFFMLGLMVGNLTSTSGEVANSNPSFVGYVEDCRVSGLVTFQKNGNEFPDKGAVVLLFPRSSSPPTPQTPGLVMPKTFVALDNPTIEAIHTAGGAVVRADSDGKFEVLVDQGREYRLLVVSKNRTPQGSTLTEPQQLLLESWFSPAEKLIRDNDFQWRDINGNAERVDAGSIQFNQ